MIVNWTVDEIATGFALSYMGKRGYNFTIHKLGIPLPSIRTLQKWGERIKISPDILYDCFMILKAMGSSLTEEEFSCEFARLFHFYNKFVYLSVVVTCFVWKTVRSLWADEFSMALESWVNFTNRIVSLLFPFR